jgi:uncharacterized repeat protein (TIGR03803 family)
VPEAPASHTSGGYRSLYSFGRDGKSGDGNRAVAPLVAVGARLYGTAQYGGITNAHCDLGCGIVFAVSESGNESVLYRFKGGSDGAQPLGELTVVNGKLIGTTSGGGASGCAGGCGSIFELSTAGSETILYRFAGGSDGAVPAAGLIAVGTTLYGTTQRGGMKTPSCPHGCGTVFSVSEDGSEHVIYRFQGGKDGAYPVARLIVDGSTLFGTTQYGGPQTPFCATGCGTLFQISTAGVKKMLHGFSYGPKSQDGAYPAAGVVEYDGKLYGTTMGGGRDGDGSVFDADPSTGAEHVLHFFSCCGTSTDGTFPFARLVRIGNVLFGTTRDGGTSNAGTIFNIRPSGLETVVHNFAGRPDGAQPEAGLVVVGRTLFGTTSSGGARSQGTIFEQKE